jgi:hypothetical protein
MKFSDESIRAALRGRHSVSRFPFPGLPNVELGVRLLTDAELDGARLQAVEFCKRNKVELALDPEFLDRAIHREVISRAFVDANNEEDAFFGSQDDVAELDSLTVRTLFELYAAHQQAMDPYAFCPAEDVDRMVDALGKSESSVVGLSLFDAPTLRSFVLSMASMLREMQQPPK